MRKDALSPETKLSPIASRGSYQHHEDGPEAEIDKTSKVRRGRDDTVSRETKIPIYRGAATCHVRVVIIYVTLLCMSYYRVGDDLPGTGNHFLRRHLLPPLAVNLTALELPEKTDGISTWGITCNRISIISAEST